MNRLDLLNSFKLASPSQALTIAQTITGLDITKGEKIMSYEQRPEFHGELADGTYIRIRFGIHAKREVMLY